MISADKFSKLLVASFDFNTEQNELICNRLTDLVYNYFDFLLDYSVQSVHREDYSRIFIELSFTNYKDNCCIFRISIEEDSNKTDFSIHGVGQDCHFDRQCLPDMPEIERFIKSRLFNQREELINQLESLLYINTKQKEFINKLIKKIKDKHISNWNIHYDKRYYNIEYEWEGIHLCSEPKEKIRIDTLSDIIEINGEVYKDDEQRI